MIHQQDPTLPTGGHTAGRALIAASVAVALVLGAVALAEDGSSLAHVNTTALNLRAAPGSGGAKVGILLLYDPLVILDRRDVGGSTWYEVEAGGGYTEGWVSAKFVDFGPPPPGAVPEFVGDYGEQQTPTLRKGEFKYVGTQACRECHEDSTGDFDTGAVTVWDGHDHSEAWHTLQRDYTRDIAMTRRGVQDPANDWRCIKCHVTAYGADPAQLAPTYEAQEGVTCEACHGPGSGYAQEDHGPTNTNRTALGFRIARDLEERTELCTSCHNPASPTYKPFNLREYSRSIAHWVDRGDEAYFDAFIREAKRRKARAEAAEAALLTQAVDTALADAGMPVTPAPPVEVVEETPPVEEIEEPPPVEIVEETPPVEIVEEPPPIEIVEEAPPVEIVEEPPPVEIVEEAAPVVPDTEEARRREELALQAAKLALAVQAEKGQASPMPAPEVRAAAEEAAAKKLEEDKAREQEARQKDAQLALVKQKEHEKEREAARAQTEQKVKKATSSATGTKGYLKQVDDTLILNKDGVKNKTVKFSHLAHASEDYVPGVECVTCHHTVEPGEKPEGCNTCHAVGGDADETKQKSRASHSKQHPFPMEPGQEQVSCYACHKAQNALLEAGKRQGDEAPTKCTACHAKKAG